MSYLRKRGNAFKFAFQGLVAASKEAHLQIHLLALIVVIAAAFYFNVKTTEWCLLIFSSAFVICLELANSAIEKLCDVVTTDLHPAIKFVKDVMAAAVLVAAISAVLIGCLVFWPYFIAVLA